MTDPTPNDQPPEENPQPPEENPSEKSEISDSSSDSKTQHPSPSDKSKSESNEPTPSSKDATPRSKRRVLVTRGLLVLGALLLAIALVFLANAQFGLWSLPKNAIAEVNGEVITESEFDHWFTIATKQQGAGAPPLDAPEFTKCTAALKKTQADVPQQELLTQCETAHKQVKEQVAQFLISSAWITQEAQERDVVISDAAVGKSFQQKKQQFFPQAKDFQAFLKSSGQTEADLRERTRVELLSEALRKDVTKKALNDISDRQIQTYYQENREDFPGQADQETIDKRVRSLLGSQAQQRAADAFIKKFSEKWRKRTECAEAYKVKECSNGPSPEDAPQPGAPQQGPPPQGAPQQGAPPQGAPQQGAPQQGAPQQGAPQQGAPPQGTP